MDQEVSNLKVDHHQSPYKLRHLLTSDFGLFFYDNEQRVEIPRHVSLISF